MNFIAIIAAGIGAWIFGAIWYSVMAKPWLEDVGLTEETIDRKNPVPYIASFLGCVIVAGMMAHIFRWNSVDTLIDGIKLGIGLGLFISVPWLMSNYLFAQRPKRLIFIDGMYATGGCAVIGAVLSFF